MLMHLPFICGSCKRIVWPWQPWITYYDLNVEGSKQHEYCVCKKAIILTCDNPKEFMKEWERMKEEVE